MQTTPNPTDLGKQFDQQLLSCQSVQEMRDLVRQLQIKVLQVPDYSRRMLRQLLSLDCGVTKLHSFILDATLYVPGSGCFEEVFLWLTSKPHSQTDMDSFYTCVQRILCLGLLSGRELRVLMIKLWHANVDQQGSISKLCATPDIQKWFWMMADSLKTCQVMGLEDLDQDHLVNWLFCVSTAPFAPCALDTFRMLQWYLVERNALKVNLMQGLVQKWIKYAGETRLDSVTDSIELQDGSNLDFEMIADFLTCINRVAAASCVCRISEKLVRDVMKGSRTPNALEIWMQILSHVSKSSADSLLKNRIWKDGLGENASASMLSSQQKIVVRLWTVTRLAAQGPEAEYLQNFPSLTRHLVRLFERQLRPGHHLLVEIMSTIQSLPLPSPSAALETIAKTCRKGFLVHGSIDRLQADLLTMSSSRIAVFKEDAIYKNAKINHIEYVTVLAGRATKNPEEFLDMAHALIMRDKLSLKIVTRILRHSLALNITLSHAAIARQREPPQSQHPSPPYTPARPNPPPVPPDPGGAPQPPTPAMALYLLNSLARSFALSPALSHRQSFRKVYWIYLHIHRYTCGAAIGPEIVRALWHAGVTRYKETGTSPTKVGWILQQVREVEGREVADRLLWFGAGGVKGWEDWMRRLCGGVDVQGWRRVAGWKRLVDQDARIRRP